MCIVCVVVQNVSLYLSVCLSVCLCVCAFSVSSNAVYIGVHIRRADMVTDYKYTVADTGYFRRAVLYMTRKFPNNQLVFVVCTDELLWSKLHFSKAVAYSANRVTVGIHGNSAIGNHNDSYVIRTTTTTTTTTNNAIVVFSEDRRAEEDLAILSSCNHTIMSVGTFGWWAGYLAGGVTVYYRNFPRRGAELMPLFSRADFFPPEWIGL